MPIRPRKISLLAICLVISIAVHSLALCAVRMLGSYDFGAPVGESAVLVDLVGSSIAAKEVDPADSVSDDGETPAVVDRTATADDARATEAKAVESHEAAASPEVAEGAPSEEEPVEPPPPTPPGTGGNEPHALAEAPKPPAPAASEVTTAEASAARPAAAPPSITKSAFPAAREEKLTYLISMLGLPIGKAELEAKNNGRGTTLTLRVRSNPAMSGVYPVDDLVETQQVDGRYLMTRVQQREGNFRSDEGFSINIPQRSVSWSDNINYRNKKMTVPTEDVLDTLSGIYSLRNRALQVGKTETLHIFDSETYAEVPVEVLRREEMRLPNLSKVDALVVRPLQKSAGIFRRTGDILIWMTDDAKKVPVKIVTTIALGRVTAELVSAETHSHDGEAKGKVD
ncbi:DUF3108 domain-containing protein [Geomonas sp. RF6]|uniref:DUF3108 domain-containing protein n=1 Tax=Geomonas sp. RF6 TaxID=2897342 RepID=UPI001E53762A|nr:DUF3108 domain-containing protein [Geomonas sp. RF6]UFS72108.1 DUF3108 domain-containing protein [Geomonas sp. RF6]